MYETDAIIHIGEAGLEYVDEYGDVRFINFEACGQNAVKFSGTPKAEARVARRVVQIEQNGETRQTLEFFTQPPTVFVLEDDRQFERVRFRLEQMGWRVT